MLTIMIKGTEYFDETESKFLSGEDVQVDFEHSLISLSKWESKFQKPFLSGKEHSPEEIAGYFQAMIITPGISLETISRMTEANILEIQQYLESKQSATTFGLEPEVRTGRGETITSELIYYWMVAFNIPFECETWHLNRLFALIRICNLKNSKPKKMSRNALAQRNREINEQRRKELGTRG